MSAFEGEFGVCSRDLWIDETDEAMSWSASPGARSHSPAAALAALFWSLTKCLKNVLMGATETCFCDSTQ